LKKLIIALFICTAFSQTAVAEETKKQTPEVQREFHKFDPKQAKPVLPDRVNLEKNKDMVKIYKEYWNAVKDKDYKKAYSMEAASYQKAVSYDVYLERHKNAITILAVEPIEVSKKNEKEVIVKGFLRYKTGVMDSVRTFDDGWIKEGDVLKHLKENDTKDLKKNDKGGGDVKPNITDIKKLDK